MNAKKILFPTDFSVASQGALAQASALARESGGTLIVCHVEEPPMAYGGGEVYLGPLPEDVDELRRMLTNVRPTDSDVPVVHHLLSGDPAEEIVRLAEEEQVDMIVMATHGRTGLRRLVMGSVAEAVVRSAPCPVFTLKQPAQQPARV